MGLPRSLELPRNDSGTKTKLPIILSRAKRENRLDAPRNDSVDSVVDRH